MIDAAEREVCQRRGHKTVKLSSETWAQCEWCGVWLREARKIEERGDDPPENERSPMDRLKQRYGDA